MLKNKHCNINIHKVYICYGGKTNLEIYIFYGTIIKLLTIFILMKIFKFITYNLLYEYLISGYVNTNFIII